MGLDGKIHRLNAEDLLAQALEHEIDHLNGILYIDHLVDHESLYKITYEHDPQEEEFDGDLEHEDDPEYDDDDEEVGGLDEALGAEIAASNPAGNPAGNSVGNSAENKEE